MKRPAFIVLLVVAIAGWPFLHLVGGELPGFFDLNVRRETGIAFAAVTVAAFYCTISILPWSVGLWFRRRHLQRTPYWSIAPLAIMAASLALLILMWLILQTIETMEFNGQSRASFDVWLARKNRLKEMSDYVGAVGIVLFVVSPLVALGLSIPALKADPRPVEETFE